jgi:hypothetical protein
LAAEPSIPELLQPFGLDLARRTGFTDATVADDDGGRRLTARRPAMP